MFHFSQRIRISICSPLTIIVHFVLGGITICMILYSITSVSTERLQYRLICFHPSGSGPSSLQLELFLLCLVYYFAHRSELYTMFFFFVIGIILKMQPEDFGI